MTKTHGVVKQYLLCSSVLENLSIFGWCCHQNKKIDKCFFVSREFHGNLFLLTTLLAIEFLSWAFSQYFLDLWTYLHYFKDPLISCILLTYFFWNELTSDNQENKRSSRKRSYNKSCCSTAHPSCSEATGSPVHQIHTFPARSSFQLWC